MELLLGRLRMRLFDWHYLARLLLVISLCSAVFQLWNSSRGKSRVIINRRTSFNNSLEEDPREREMELRSDIKRILYWTTFNNKEDFVFGLGEEPFSNCEYSKCESTNDRELLKYSDAVVFNLNNINMEDLPPSRTMKQSWVLVNGESPLHIRDLNIDGLFNLTMTYKSDSDIPFQHGKIVSLSDHERTTFERSYARYNWAQGKTKLVAWFVSHCKTPSKREQFVAELQKFIPVDIYGECGPMDCGKGNYECDTILAKYYKFYLSFENSLCKDYVTEKLWHPLMNGVVPIVMGYVNYKALLPNDSYIDVKDFKFIRQLAMYLLDLDQDDARYNQMFEWRKKQKALSTRFRDSFCKLCKHLHTSDEDDYQTIEDFDLWNSKMLNCQTPPEYYGPFIDKAFWLDDAIKEAELRAKEQEEALQRNLT